MSTYIDLKDQTFGRLTVLEKTDKRCGTNVVWRCRCICNTVKDISGVSLRSGNTTSCGCYWRERVVETFTTHGMSGSPEYQTWNAIHQRTSNTNDKAYQDYGGRGIEVCERWHTFENFLADMGPRPGPEYSIEREDNDKGYEPGNCRWATQQEQANNRRTNAYVSHNGKTQTIAQWSRELGIPDAALRYRLSEKKQSIEEAILDLRSKKAA